MPADRPRVAFITDIITPYMAAVMEALAERVELTALFCSRSGSRAADWVFDDGLPFRHRVLGGWAIRRRTDGTDFYPSPRILRALAKERPDAVISGGFSFPSAYAAAYGGLRGAGLVIHSDGRATPSATSAGRSWRRARCCCGRPGLVWATPSRRRNDSSSLERPARVFRAPHTTNIAPYWEAHERRSQARPAEAGSLRLVTVGRLIPRKGVDRLLRAVAIAARQNPGSGSWSSVRGPRRRRFAR